MSFEAARVVVAFSDMSLGGTSRSALLAGEGWRHIGYNVQFLAMKGVHPDRLARFERVGSVVESPNDIDWSMIDTVHLHHGIIDRAQTISINALIRTAIDKQANATLVTNNVFGVSDVSLDAWPTPRIVNVLGGWSRLQLEMSMWPRRIRGTVNVAPNPQDFGFFRPPSPSEREDARARFSVGNARVLLRVGSPARDKWSSDYLALAETLTPTLRLIALGTPPGLFAHLRHFSWVHLMEPTSDDHLIRDLYWASDLMVLSAKQGESFGNVILEALGCGLPVTYRSRPFRDNTPWDFQGIPGFHLARSKGEWLAHAQATPRQEVAHQEWRDWFDSSAVANLLAGQVASLRAGTPAPITSWPHKSVGTKNVLCILTRHNIAAATVLRSLRALRSRARDAFA